MPDTKRSLSALQALLADNTAGDIGALDIRDFLLSTMLLDSLEISITTTATATLGAMHVCSGTSADYIVTLPTAVGNANKFMSFRMSTALTKIVTLDANGTETINDALTRIMHAGESAILISDGVQWLKTSGVSIPLIAKSHRNSSNQSGVASATWTPLVSDAQVSGPTAMWDAANTRLKCIRPGNYNLTAFAQSVTTITDAWYLSCSVNGGSFSDYPSAGAFAASLVASRPYIMSLNDYAQPAVYVIQSGTTTWYGSPVPNSIVVQEIVTW